MSRRLPAGLAIVMIAWLFSRVPAWGFPQDSRTTGAACAACHVNPAGGPELSEAGTTYAGNKKKVPPKGGGAQFVGDQKCRSCHVGQYAAWKETAHAHSFATLLSARDTTVAAIAKRFKVTLKAKASESDACVRCHVVGLGIASGYPAADSLKNAALGNVTCESCHGPGSKHLFAKPAEMRSTIHGKVGAKTCLQCHTAVMSPKFVFEEYRKTGVHTVKAPE